MNMAHEMGRFRRLVVRIHAEFQQIRLHLR